MATTTDELLWTNDQAKTPAMTGLGRTAARFGPALSPYAAGLLTLAIVVTLRWFFAAYLRDAPPLVFFLFPALVAAWAGGVGPGVVFLVASGLVGWYQYVPPGESFKVDARNSGILMMYLFQGASVVVLGSVLRRFHIRQENEDLQRRDIATALRKSETRYRNVVAASSSIVWSTDARGSFVEHQQSWQDYTGQTWEEMKGWGWVNAIDEASREEIEKKWRRMLANPKVYVSEGNLWNAEKKQYRHFLARSLPIRDENGEVIEWVGTVTDVHEQVTAQRELQEAKARAEAANKAKTQFLANMSHEIRTPLGVIIGFSDLLLSQIKDGDSSEHAKTIKRNAEMLAQLVNEVLDVSKVEADRLEVEDLAFSLPAFLSEMRGLFSFKAAEKGLELVMKASGSVPEHVVTDPTRLRQILTNVVGNAIKFTERGRVVVTVRATRVPPDSDRLVLEFQVDDTGIGMSDDQKTRLFQPFMQADESMTRRFGGTGLGLYLSRRLANLLGGDLELVESRPNVGSCFRVTIQARTVDEASTGEEEVEIQKPAESAFTLPAVDLTGISVLLVEDAVDNQVLVGRILQNAGVRVDMVTNGFDAIERAMSREFDLILMDIQMPQLDGFEATQELRQRGYRRPIVALTAHAMKSDKQRCFEVGCDDYLSKPFEGRVLLEKVAQHVNRCN